jgi:cytochrome c oxidase subunit 1
MPRIRSERPAFDLKFPHLAAGHQGSLGPPEGGAPPRSHAANHGATYQDYVSPPND